MKALRIKEILKEKEMTATELSQLTGLSRVYISDVSNNHKFPRKETLFLIAEKLDVDVRELLVSTKSKDLSDPLEAFKEIKRIVDGVKE